MTEEHEFGNWMFGDRLQNRLDRGSALIGQLVRLEPEVQREVLRRRREGRQRVSEDSTGFRLAQGGRFRRWLAFKGYRRMVGRGQAGCPSRVRDRRASGCVRVAVGKQDDERLTRALGRLNTYAGAGGSPSTSRNRDEQRDRPRRVHSGTTRSASVVPRTPTIAAGVSRWTASGDILAIRPET